MPNHCVGRHNRRFVGAAFGAGKISALVGIIVSTLRAPKVREWMVSRQRAIGAGGGVVMEGSDIGTKVFPETDLKIILDADPVIREQR